MKTPKPKTDKNQPAKVVKMSCEKRRGCIVTKLPYCKAA